MSDRTSRAVASGRQRVRFPARSVMGLGLLALLIAATLDACGGGDAPAAAPDTARADSAQGGAATPVHMSAVTRGNIAVVVSGPGHTDALDVQKLRAPFTGTLQELSVVVGDRVQAGQTIAAMASQASVSALTGAQIMLTAAKSAAERADAERALELAKQNLVQTMLRAPRAGVVVSRAASQGDLVSQGDSIVSIASEESIVFVARMAQHDLVGIRAGQAATVDMPGRAAPLIGVVHGFLPADTSAMTVSVRIDLGINAAGVPIGMFGTAHITVSQQSGVSIVPSAAILRDDISGISRIATVTPGGQLHWVTVTVGAQQGDAVAILTPPIRDRTRVITSGQVGLAEGTRVRESSAEPSPSTSGAAGSSPGSP
ncbi:MAG: efflux RND transporter periplasmic adaptor subunit [Gemmatimonadales bacterium]